MASTHTALPEEGKPIQLNQHQVRSTLYANRSTEDAVITALHTAPTQLDQGNTYLCCLKISAQLLIQSCPTNGLKNCTTWVWAAHCAHGHRTFLAVDPSTSGWEITRHPLSSWTLVHHRAVFSVRFSSPATVPPSSYQHYYQVCGWYHHSGTDNGQA